MATFNDDMGNMPEQPQQGSFLGDLGSSLWKAIKFTATAALAVTGIGALFNYSDTTRVFVDKYTGGKENEGIASQAAGLYRKGVDAFKDFINPPPTTMDVSYTTKIGGDDFLLPKGNLLSPLPEKYLELQNVTAERKKINVGSVAIEDRGTRNRELDDKQFELLRLGREFEAWNKANDKHGDENPGRYIVPPRATLNLPEVKGYLDQYGRNSDEKWDEKSTLEKITFLSTKFKGEDNKPNFSKVSLNTEGVKGTAVTTMNSAMDTFSEVHVFSPLSTIMRYYDIAGAPMSQIDNVLADTRIGRKIIPDVGLEIAWKESISKATKSGDLDKAMEIAGGAETYFNGRREIFNANEANINNTEEGKRHNNVIADFGDIKKYLTGLKARVEFGPVIDETNKAILEAGKDLSNKLLPTYVAEVKKIEEKYNIQQGIAQKENNAVPPSASTKESDTLSGGNHQPAIVETPTADAKNVGGNGSGKKDSKDVTASSPEEDKFKMLLSKVDSVSVSTPTIPPKKRESEMGVTV